jgi:hypothetical protein
MVQAHENWGNEYSLLQRKSGSRKNVEQAKQEYYILREKYYDKKEDNLCKQTRGRV